MGPAKTPGRDTGDEVQLPGVYWMDSPVQPCRECGPERDTGAELLGAYWMDSPALRGSECGLCPCCRPARVRFAEWSAEVRVRVLMLAIAAASIVAAAGHALLA